MARSRRRTSRRTTTQRAAGLIALALPAPVQRVADTRLGSLLMLVGAPVAIMFGLLNVTWVDGFPTFTFNRNKAAELRNVATQQINNLENEAISQNWGQTTVDFLHAAQGPNHQHIPFPSTRPQSTSSAYNSQQSTYPTQPYGQQAQYQQPQYPASNQQQQYPAAYSQPQYPANYQQPYQQQPYQQGYSQGYQQQAPQASYQQPYAAQPSRASQQPAQQWQYGYSQQQQQPYQANTTAYGQGPQGGYAPQQYNYPIPSSTNNGQSAYPGQGQYGRY